MPNDPIEKRIADAWESWEYWRGVTEDMKGRNFAATKLLDLLRSPEAREWMATRILDWDEEVPGEKAGKIFDSVINAACGPERE